MDSTFFSSYKIDDRSYVAFVKREIHNLLINSGFSTQKAGEVDIVVSELTSNLIKYAQSGELLYRIDSDESNLFFEIFCIDNGVGIANVAKMMKDGNTSSSSLGQGLGAIDRLSDFFQIYTLRDWGTVQHSKIYREPFTHVPGRKAIDFGVTQVCAPGELICGDGYFVKMTGKGMQILVGDGLGHGMKAHEAVKEAIASFIASKQSSPAEILKEINNDVKKTRGLVGMVASLDFSNKEWRLCGVGNISTRIYEGMLCKNYNSYNGIIGHNFPRTLNESVVPMVRHQTLIMHSDGLNTRWNMANLPSILKFDPRIIATTLYKDNARRNDDMTVLVAKINI